MSSQAPGQLLGYTLQYPRALYHLLRADKGDMVCIEVIGDVGTIKTNGDVISEEDKSSISHNPLTDRSEDLWKTFYNWINLIKTKKLDINKTKFLLYSTKSGRTSIVNEFSSASSNSEIRVAIEHAREILSNISHEHEIWKYYNVVLNEDVALLEKILPNFELQIGQATGFEEVEAELIRIFIPEHNLEFVKNEISGWVVAQVCHKIAQKELAIISRDDFDHHFGVMFNRIRRRELINYASKLQLCEEELNGHQKASPRYLKQLDIIDADYDIIIESITDFLRADVNRSKWIENEFVDEELMQDFYNKLKSFWKNTRTKINITEKTLNAKEKGMLLLTDCKSRQETINDMNPPDSTISGTYHFLADKSILGWHMDWENVLTLNKDA